MAGIIFPTDLQQVKPKDDTLLLGADANNIARNIKASELVDYVKSNVPLDELAETISEQQDTISEQQTTASEQAQTIARLVATQSAPALEAELAAGKTDLASAITAKGVETAPTDSLATMADKVREVVQETITINGGEFYPNNMLGSTVWNLFEVAAMVKSQYISSGRYAGAIVAQYYKGYATLDLTLYGGGYAACLTCDGDFYANDGEHTPIGVHTWHDDDTGKVDRYVVFLWLEDNYTFQSLSASVCPREIVVVGTCESIQINYNRLVQLYAPAEFGELKNFRLAGSDTPQGNWAAVQVWEHYKEHATGTIFQNVNTMIYAEFSTLQKLSGGSLMSSNNSFTSLVSLSLPALTEISGGSLISGSYSFTSLVSLSLPALTEISGGSLMSSSGGSFKALVSLSLPALTEISGGSLISSENYSFTSLVSLSLPALIKVSGGSLIRSSNNGGNSFTMLEEIVLPELEAITGSYRPIISGGGPDIMPNSHAYFPKLRSFFTTTANAYGMMSLVRYIYYYVLEIGTYWVAGSAAAGYGSYYNKYILFGCKGTRTQLIKVDGYATTFTFEVEIGDKEYIDAGLQPRWQPRQPLNFAKVVLTAENLALRILDRLADNTYEDDGVTPAEPITITLGASNISRLEADETYAPYIAAAQAKNYTIV